MKCQEYVKLFGAIRFPAHVKEMVWNWKCCLFPPLLDASGVRCAREYTQLLQIQTLSETSGNCF